MDAETLSQCNECILASITYIFSWKYKDPLTHQLCTRLVTLQADVGNPKLTAEFLSELYTILNFSDAVICDLKKPLTADQLKEVCSHMSAGCVDALKLEYHKNRGDCNRELRLLWQSPLVDRLFKMTTLLIQLLQLSDTPLFDQLRPVDLLQLTLTGKECQEIIQSQRHPIRHTYWKYYGPLLAAYRVKSHAQLQLKTVQDYKIFMPETLDCDHAFHLRALALDYLRPLQEPINKLWNRAILEVCASKGDRSWPYGCAHFNEWQEFYSSPGQYVSPHHSEVFATSQLDFLITIFRASLDSGCIQWNMQNFVEADGKQMRNYQSSVGRYGYLYDAIKNYGLQALVITIGDQYDKYYIRAIIRPDRKFVQGICRYFQLGDGNQVLKALDNQMKTSPSFQVLLAYYTLLLEVGLSDQLDKEAHMKESIAQIINHHNQIPVTQYDNKKWQRIQESLQISDALQDVIYDCLTHGQVWDFIWSIVSDGFLSKQSQRWACG
ncbi:hypothetical protein MIR68_006786 [Amoeboaphelidium protococcarum]|nr:hypothetical protein MIR68_006786 [Amoeboaphelidium protococcarum]